ncbi:efflux RND transporter periplasmic adaptor subunit [Tundrisphaera lichenicola]|uniref:efflux RND transporter periplasmic adaptor subunit n=1 Tax=Tundrisphaera lichenicola TaxID=2029860 RepID=UPI003EC14446
MPLIRKALALSVGLSAILTASSIAQSQKPEVADSQLIIEDATIDFYQKSDVSALREGVIEKMELRIGKEVGPPDKDGRGPVIGYLVKKAAELAAEEARIQAEGEGGLLKAKAQKELAAVVVSRNAALLRKGKGYVSQEEVQKAEAEYAVADAAVVEATDMLKLAAAKLKSAERVVEEHIIRAPFSGVIIEERKHEGESVRANEPVVTIGNLDTVRVWAYIPVEYAFRVTPGTEMVIQPRLGGNRKHPIEQKQFRGVISFVDQSIQPVAETAVRIYADLDNASHELRPGLKCTMTIFLKPESATVAAPAVRSTDGVNVGQAGLPPLPPR